MYKIYKKYSIIVLSGVIVILFSLIVAGDFIIRYCKLSRVNADVYNTNLWYERKCKLAENMLQKGNKIIFLSGSNTLFGINTKEIEDTFGIPALNFGVHAGYYYITFDKAIDYIKENDIIILPLELVYYAADSQENYINDFIASYIISYYKERYNSLSFSNKLYCIRYLYFQYPFNIKEKEYTPVSIGPYSINSWNINGDNVCERKSNQKISSDWIIKLNEFDLNHINNKDTYLNKFLQICKNKNTKVYFMPPVIMEGTYDDTTLKILAKIWKELKYPHILEIKDSIYSKDLFYMTNNHLSSEGAHIRTQQIIKAMEQAGFKRKK